ncbi:MAG: hypothetical protein ACQETB_03920 [Halobacteriota archaeon]
MWSSSLPTGTVNADRPGERTYPIDPVSDGSDERAAYPTRRELAQKARDRERAVRECDRLRTQVSLLRDELDRERTERKRIVQRYEYLLADCRRVRRDGESESSGPFERVGVRLDAVTARLVDLFGHA